MEENLRKYARVLLSNCLKIEVSQPLFISFNVERIDFARIVASEALKMGIKDIYFDIVDPYLKHDLMKNLEVDDLKKLPYWNRDVWNEYAKLDAAFLMLASEMPGLNEDLDTLKQHEMSIYTYNSRQDFNTLRNENKLSWCIAAVPTLSWAKDVFGDSLHPVEDLWNKILEICGIFEDDPVKFWNDKINVLKKRATKLNEYHFKKLIYTNSKGTNFTIELPDNHIWQSGEEKLVNGRSVLVNFPTEEVFTSPNYKSANGRVYSSKPLNNQDVTIDDFYLDFEDGKVVSCKAKAGEEVLKAIINSCDNACYLGEVALVPYDSPISASNIIFKETLFDENASCHLALGAGFRECIIGGTSMNDEELLANNVNVCDTHVDFMIGTKDLNIVGITASGSEITIFENGNFSSYFE